MSPTNGFQCSLPDEVASPSHDDIRMLEDEIFELQEYSTKVEQDISRLKLDTHQLQNQTKLLEKVCCIGQQDVMLTSSSDCRKMRRLSSSTVSWVNITSL